MRLTHSPLFAALLVSASTLSAQPRDNVTAGWLDFRSITAGAPALNGTGIATGPYRATFSTSSLANAQGQSALQQFNVFCIDWRGIASDSKVTLLTFSQAASNGPLLAKYADAGIKDGTTGGLTTTKLNAAAWLTTQFGATPTKAWDEMHLALWSIFWDPATGSPALPNAASYGLGSNGGVSGQTAQYWVSQALAHANSFDASAFRVVTPVNSSNVLDPSKQIFLVQTVPEPSTYAMLGVGLAALGVAARRRRRQR